MNISAFSNERLLRLGFAVGALAAVLGALAGLASLSEGPARRAPVVETARLDVEAVVAVIALIALVVIVVAALVPRAWLRPIGVLATTSVATSAGIEVLRGRIADIYAPEVRTTLLTGGILLVVAFWLAVVAVAVQLVALRQIAQTRPQVSPEELEQYGLRPDGRPLRTSITASVALLVGVAGVVMPVFSGAAAALGISSLADIRAADGRLGGRGSAVTAVVLGIIGMSLLIAVLGVGSLVLKPVE